MGLMGLMGLWQIITDNQKIYIAVNRKINEKKPLILITHF